MFKAKGTARMGAVAATVGATLVGCRIVSGSTMPAIGLMIKVVLTILVTLVLLKNVEQVKQIARGLMPFVTLICVILTIKIVVLGVKRIPTIFTSVIRKTFRPTTIANKTIKDFFVDVGGNISHKVFSGRTKLNAKSVTRTYTSAEGPIGRKFFKVFRIFMSAVIVYALATLIVLYDRIPIDCNRTTNTRLAVDKFATACKG